MLAYVDYIKSLRERRERSKTISDLQHTVNGFDQQLADAQRTAQQKEHALNKTIKSQHGKMVDLEKTVEELRGRLAGVQRTVDGTLSQFQTELGGFEERTDALTKRLEESPTE